MINRTKSNNNKHKSKIKTTAHQKRQVEDEALDAGGPATAKLSSVTVIPKLIKQVNIEYPEKLKPLEIQGRVKLLLWIDKKGKVIKAKVIKSLHPEFDKLALEASKKLKFMPAMRNNKPVPVKIVYSFVFVLD